MVAGGHYAVERAFPITLLQDSSVEVYEVSIVLVMVVRLAAIPFVRSRLTAILLNGVLGFAVAFFFVIFRAPDSSFDSTRGGDGDDRTCFYFAFITCQSGKKSRLPPEPK